MTSISAVYGGDFQQSSLNAKNSSTIANLANNIANRQFNMRLHDTLDFWRGNRIPSEYVKALLIQTMKINTKLYMEHIDPNSADINMFPVLIENSPVEYFYIIDNDTAKAYFIYITPKEINSM